MPFDAVFLSAVAEELRGAAVGCRVDRIQQPSRDTLILQFRGAGRLLVTASPNQPRIHFTQTSLENPAQPPMFCMLLRKHLTGGRLAEIRQPGLERMLDLVFDCTDDFGDSVQKHLILEAMGRNSNLILTGPDSRILDCLRRVDFEMSEDRQVLPGLYYRLPPSQGKLDPYAQTEESLSSLLSGVTGQKQFDRWLLDTFCGVSPLLCRELTFSLFGDIDTDLSLLDEDARTAAAAGLYRKLQNLRSGTKIPVLLLRDGKPWDFSCIPVRQYGDLAEVKQPESFSALLDTFYSDRDKADRIRQKTQVLRKSLSNLQSRTERKLLNQRRELEGTRDREKLRRLGDIVTSNLHAISRGQASLTAVDFYDPDMKEITIPLNPAVSPQQNAAKYYKDYQKAKTAEKILTEQIAKGEQELEYLGSVQDALSRAELDRDIHEIREELEAGGYLRRTDRKRMKLPPSKPMKFRSSDGYRILVGRNNRQNDQLTLKTAAKTDIWLHTQKVHGSHVIICCDGTVPPDETVTEAMELAVWYSQARGGQNVAVDYTQAKFVRKPAGANPGMVIYDRYSTAMATPDPAKIERMREG